MKSLLTALILFASVSSFAGDMYLSCGMGEEEHWDNFTDSLLDESDRGMVNLLSGTNKYVITYDGENYRYIKSNSNTGGFIEETIAPASNSKMKVTAIIDNIWCHLND
jgi:hypothetical protein